MGNLVLYFESLVINTTNFMIFQLQNYLQIFAILTYFIKIWTINAYKKKLWLTITITTTHKKPCITFSSVFGHPKFFYRYFKKIENFYGLWITQKKLNIFESLTVYR